MKKRKQNETSFTQKVIELNKKAIAHEHVVNLDAYRSITKQNTAKSILIVEPNTMELNSLKRVMEREEYHVFVAKDAMEVAKAIEDTKLDAILLDVHIPWVDGYELCYLLKSSPFLKDLPIILLSSNKTEEDLRKGFEAGCDEYITKPFNTEELQHTVAKLLNPSI